MKLRNWKKSQWLYSLEEPFVHLALRVMFRKIYVSGIHKIPANTPVLLAVNHPTAFVEPVVLSALAAPPVYNMVRGDFFERPLFDKLMRATNMFPIYRARDGYTDRERNQDVFDFSSKMLKTGHCIAIYVEGQHHLEKRLRPVERGICRIAFDTCQNHGVEDLVIIPVGCNFESGAKFRDVIMLVVQEPIYVRDYMEEYQTQSGRAQRRLRDDIELHLKQACHHIESEADDDLAEKLLLLNRNNHPENLLPLIQYDRVRFDREKALLDTLNGTQAEAKTELQERVNAYFSAIEAKNLSDFALSPAQKIGWSRLLFFVFGFPFFIAGWAFHLIPGRIAWNLTDKKVKKREFYSSVLLGGGLIIHQIWYIILLFVALVAWQPIWLAAILVMPLLGWFSVVWKERFLQYLDFRRAENHPNFQQMRTLRQNIFSTN